MSLLQSRYPILSVPMNQVSDINLAVAVQKAGAYPSLSLFNYYSYESNKYDLDLVDRDLNFFKQQTGSNGLLFSMGAKNLIFNKQLLEILVANEILDIELLEDVNDQTIPYIQKIRQQLKSKNFRIFLKETSPKLVMEVDALILKGPDGAGRSSEGRMPLRDLFLKMKKAFPNIPMIPSGGIGTSEDVKSYLEIGAAAVGIGTLFAASTESSISYETKLKMVKSTFKDIEKFENLDQNALIFKKIDHDDFNHTLSLKLGIKNPDLGGHVFAGKSIDNINSIKPVKEIVEDLVRELHGN